MIVTVTVTEQYEHASEGRLQPTDSDVSSVLDEVSAGQSVCGSVYNLGVDHGRLRENKQQTHSYRRVTQPEHSPRMDRVSSHERTSPR